jgi:hypothetical protein
MKRSNAKNKIMLNVTVADITYSRRVVSFSSVCPNCKADLTEPGALLGAEYQAQTRLLAIENDCDVTYDENASSDCSDQDIGWVDVFCNRCTYAIVSGDKQEHTKVG